jgi:hypothetical protein
MIIRGYYFHRYLASLWQTLEEWATKAEDEKKWQEKILKLAEQEPKALKPFERELVTYLISSFLIKCINTVLCFFAQGF